MQPSSPAAAGRDPQMPAGSGALMKGVAGIEQIATSDDLPDFDVYCPLMTLPLVFSTRLETIPANVPYIQVDAHLADMWGRKIVESKDKLKVGLVWAGGAAYKNDRKRSTTLAQLAPLAHLADMLFYSLQKRKCRRSDRPSATGHGLD